MILDEFELSKVNYWNSYIISINEEVYDYVIINYTDLEIELKFRFKRCKNFCFFESFLDYAIKYIIDIECMELKKQLDSRIPYLELDKGIKVYDDI